MARKTVTALAVVALLAGAAMDGMTGLRGQYGGDERAADSTLIELADGYGGHFRVYRELRGLAPGSTFLIDCTRENAGLRTTELLALAGADDVVCQPLPELPANDAVPDGAAEFRGRSWSIWVGAASPERLAVQSLDGISTEIVDVALLSGGMLVGELPGASQEVIRSVPRPGQHSRSAVETLVYIVLLLLGGFLVPRGDQLAGWLRIPLAFIGSLSVLGLGGLLRPSGAATLLAVPVAVALLALAIRRLGGRSGWGYDDLPALALASLVVGVMVFRQQLAGSIVVSADSFSYLLGGHEMFAGRFDIGDFSVKRGAFLQGIYAAGFLLGLEGLPSVGLVSMVAAAAVLVGFGVSRSVRRDVATTVVVVGLSILPLLSFQLVSMARYVNSHFLIAAILLLFVLVLHVRHRTSEGAARALEPLLGILAAAPVIMRAEGALLVLLVLIGTLRSARPAPTSTWLSLSAATVVWGGMLVAGPLSIGRAPSRLVILLIVAGVLIAAAPLLLRSMSERTTRLAPLAVGAFLWAFVVLVVTETIARNVSFVTATVANLGQGFGRWGLAGPTLFIAGVGAVAFRERVTDSAGISGARWLLIGFIPVSLMSKLGDGFASSSAPLSSILSRLGGGARVGWGDSVNRMWMHAVLVVLFLLMARLLEIIADREDGGSTVVPRQRPDPSDEPRQRLSVQTLVRPAAFGLAILWAASLWAPFYVTGPSNGSALDERRSDVLVIPRAGLGEPLEAGAVVVQDVTLPRLAGLPSERQDTRACVRPELLRLPVGGTVSVRFEVGDRTAIERFDLGASAGRTCVIVQPWEALPDRGRITLVMDAGTDAEARLVGLAPATEPAPLEQFTLLLGTAGSQQPTARVTDSSGATTTLDGPLALTVDVDWVEVATAGRGALTDRAVEALTLALPMLFGVMLIMLIAVERPVAAVRVTRDLSRIPIAAVLCAGVILTLVSPGARVAEPTGLGIWDHRDQLTAGDLIAGSMISQPVDPRVIPASRQFLASDLLCIEVLLATYEDRDNIGQLRYVLSDGGTQFLARVDMADVKDNTWTPACFDVAPQELLARSGDLALAIVGERGDPGSSVTAWVRPRQSGEQAATITGTVAGSHTAAGGDVVLRYRFARAPAPFREGVLRGFAWGLLIAGSAGLMVDRRRARWRR